MENKEIELTAKSLELAIEMAKCTYRNGAKPLSKEYIQDLSKEIRIWILAEAKNMKDVR